MEIKLTEEEKNTLKDLMGPNNPNDRLYEALEKLANNKKWSLENLKNINCMVNDGMGYMLKTLFTEIIPNNEWERYYGKRVFNPPVDMKILYQLGEMMRNGEITMKEMESLGFQKCPYREFIETDDQRKEKQEEEKREFHPVKNVKTKPIISKTKGKR